MPVVKQKPTSPGRRGMVRVVSTGLHKGRSVPSLTEHKTATNGQFELVWNGRDNNGDAVSDGIYQWVLIRPDGISDRGQLTLIRQR